jgi:hypothetical protein
MVRHGSVPSHEAVSDNNTSIIPGCAAGKGGYGHPRPRSSDGVSSEKAAIWQTRWSYSTADPTTPPPEISKELPFFTLVGREAGHGCIPGWYGTNARILRENTRAVGRIAGNVTAVQ